MTSRPEGAGDGNGQRSLPAVPDLEPHRTIDLRSAERPLRVGVVGCGYWGSKHVRVLHEIPSVAAVVGVDPRRERLTALQRSFPRLRVHPELAPALAEVDAVVVATPPTTHWSIARAALAAGKHVLVEKPLTTSPDQARDLIDRAEAASLVLMVGHTFEFNPAVVHLRQVMEAGELGEVFYLDAARLNLGLFRNDVNVVWDLAPHDISIANFLLGCSPSAVQAWGGFHANPVVEDVAYLRLTYPERGVTLQTHVSWLSPSKVRRLTVVGSRQMAVYNDLRDEERLRIFDKGVVRPSGDELHNIPLSYRYGGITSPYIRFDEPLRVQDEHFIDCVLSERTPRTDGLNGLDVVEAVDAAVRSMRDGGREVRLSPARTTPSGVATRG